MILSLFIGCTTLQLAAANGQAQVVNRLIQVGRILPVVTVFFSCNIKTKDQFYQHNTC